MKSAMMKDSDEHAIMTINIGATANTVDRHGVARDVRPDHVLVHDPTLDKNSRLRVKTDLTRTTDDCVHF